MNTAQNIDFQDGEILSIGFTPCMWYAMVTIKNGRVAELVEVELAEKEYRQIYGDNLEGKDVQPELNQAIIDRAKKLAICFQ